jgi:hypothetical protein
VTKRFCLYPRASVYFRPVPRVFKVRPKALLKLQSPDQLDQRVQVVQGWTWAVLIGLIAVVGGTIAWAAIAWLPTSISADGYVIPSQGWSGIETPVRGSVTSIDSNVNAQVAQGAIVATVRTVRGLVDVRAPTAGSVSELNVTRGNYVQPGDQLMIVSPNAGTKVVHAFFPVDAAVEIAPGESVDMTTASAPPSAFGYLRGRVVQVARLPATDGYLDDVLLNSTVADQVTAHGPVVDVLIALDRARTPSGYRWTIGRGPPFAPLTGGLPTRASIMVSRKHPLSYVF